MATVKSLVIRKPDINNLDSSLNRKQTEIFNLNILGYTPQSIESSVYDRLGSADDRLDRLRRLADLSTTRSTWLGRRSTRSTSST